MSTNRIIVDAKVYDEFVDRFTTHVKGLKVGNPNEPDTAIGPMINQNQLIGHPAHIQGARAAGARQVLGGDPRARCSPPRGNRTGNISPMLLPCPLIGAASQLP